MTITQQVDQIFNPEEKFFETTINGVTFKNCDGRLYILKNEKLVYDDWANPPAAEAVKKYLKPAGDWTGTKTLASGVTVKIEPFAGNTYVYIQRDGEDIRKRGCGNRSVYNNAYVWLSNRHLITPEESWEIFHR